MQKIYGQIVTKTISANDKRLSVSRGIVGESNRIPADADQLSFSACFCHHILEYFARHHHDESGTDHHVVQF